MIARDDALAAFESDRFDLVVIGGGITGAGVALDAASRGYSVALVERDDYAAGTSSRSSKLVHGGLRYLQNFDLGLVREALLERALMVKLAPHLVHPLPLLVPGFDGKRPDRLTGVGLNMYDVMALAARRARTSDDWSPARHRMIDGAEARRAGAGAGESRNPTRGLPLLRLPDRRRAARADRARRGGALRRGARQPLRGGAGWSSATGAPRACSCADRAERRASSRSRADNVVNATGVWADRIRPDELYAEEEVPRIRPEPRHARHALERPSCRSTPARSCRPAAGARSSRCPGWAAR